MDSLVKKGGIKIVILGYMFKGVIVMKNKLKKLAILSLIFTMVCSNTIFAADLKLGEVLFTKSAEWVDKEEGIAKVTLKVEAEPVTKPVDVVLVVDRSGSMDFSDSWSLEENLSGENGTVSKCMNSNHWFDGKHYYSENNIENENQDRYDKKSGCITRYDVAKSAVSTFLNEFYSRENSEESRVSLVTFNSNTDDIDKIFSSDIVSNQDFTNDKTAILNVMENITDSLGGGTNYTKALEKAKYYIDNREDKSRPTYIVFLTDGVPDPLSNDGISTATTLKQSGTIIYSIGIGENVDSSIIKKLASSEVESDGYFTTTANANNLVNFYANIATNMKNAGTDSKIMDVIGKDFEYFEDDEHIPTATPSLYPQDSEDGKTIEWTKKEITEKEKIYEFYIKLKDGEKYNNGTWNTNEKAILSYIDVNNEEKSIIAKNPSLSRHKYFVEHYLESEDGTYPSNPTQKEEYLVEEGEKVVAIPKEFDNYTFNQNIEGTVLEGIVESGNKVVLKLYYEKLRSNIVVRYVDENGVDIIESKKLNGIVGKKYNTEPEKIYGYELFEEPDNKEGIYSKTNEEVVYVYKKLSGKVIVEYIDSNGNKIAENDTYEGNVGDEYVTSRKNIAGYVSYGKEPENKNGVYIDGEILVTYVYDSQIGIVDTSDINIRLYAGILMASIIGITLVIVFGIRRAKTKDENK